MKCLTLFVTHYPVLADLETQFPDAVGNYHMSFILSEDNGEIIFILNPGSDPGTNSKGEARVGQNRI